jgi:WhiB family redox-sensing transcriptional regulator
MFAIELRQEVIDDIGAPAYDWDAASCRDEAGSLTDLFFSDQIPDIIRAKEICATCPLIEACLDGALDRREPWGVWGGQLFLNGRILAQKRKRGRPPKNQPGGIQLTA